MTKEPDLVGVMSEGGRFYLFETRTGKKCKEASLEGFASETDALISCRALNRRRKGLPKDAEAFNQKTYRKQSSE